MDLDVLGMLAKAGNMANDGSNKGDNNVNGIAALSWTFVSECPSPPDAADLMVQGEQPFLAYKTFRDSAIFTNKRLIVRDAQGITGKKVEIYSLPYKHILMWSSENAGTIDINSELELWTKVGRIKIKLSRGADIRRLDRIISDMVLLYGG